MKNLIITLIISGTALLVSCEKAAERPNIILILDWHGRLKLYDLENDLEENHNLAAEMPELTLDLYGKLISWLEEEVKHQYWPVPNPDYNPRKEVRTDAPFVDLYQAYKQGKNVVDLAHTD